MSQQKRLPKPSEQSDLFLDQATVSRPRWVDLSADIQRSVTELFARMLRQCRQGKVRSAAREVEHE
jgi:hypothetical protein